MAPSPTGEFHIGGMRTLLYNYALAKKEHGRFVLRIEDTDRERFVEGAAERLLQVIKDYGLSWDEGPVIGGPHAPYIQSERLELYRKHARLLVKEGYAYYCFCSKERLDALREEQKAHGLAATRYDKHCLSLSKEEVDRRLTAKIPYVIRFNVPPDGKISFEDKILGTVSFPTNDIDDAVLLKSDGYPTYHLAVVIDDHLMGINFVMRGVEWLPSTPKHILLYNAYKWEIPVYAHLPVLKEKNATQKLSKRTGSVAAPEFLAEGYLPEALLNFLMFLGWNPGTEKELYTLDEFVAEFSLDRVHKTDLIAFDRQKLLWMNGIYIRNLSDEIFYERVKYFVEKYGSDLNFDDFEKDHVLHALSLVKERAKTLKEVLSLIRYFFFAPAISKEAVASFAKTSARVEEILSSFEALFEPISEDAWSKESLDLAARSLLTKRGYSAREAFMTLRVATTGEATTPPIFDVLALLGRKDTLERISNARLLIYH